jgi:hypothetical protein
MSRARNYLERGERQRLLWRVMPVALAVVLGLTVIERIWFPARRQPAAPAIDTALDAVRGRPPAGDEVVIEPEPEPFVAEVIGLSADSRSLGLVRDDTFFREADMEAWQQTWKTLLAAGPASLAKTPAPRVSFAELFGQPRSFRGRLLRIKGVFHRVEELKAPENHYGIDHYWQGWLEPAGGPASPIVVQFLRLPEGMPTGLKVHEPVDVTGYFFKRYAYNAADTIRVAPLLMALEPAWKPLPPVTPGGTSLGTWAIVTMAALVAATLLGIRWAGWGERRAAEAPVDLDASLREYTPFSTEESLRRLARDDAAAEEGSR